MNHRLLTWRSTLCVVIFLLCGITPARLLAEETLQPVTVRLDYGVAASHAPFFLAKEKGYYRQQGLDVTILGGQGSLSTLQVVGAGNETFGVANLGMLALAYAKGVPVVGVAGMVQRTPESIISLPSAGIRRPADLAGKRYGADPYTTCAQLFPAFLSVNGVDPGQIKTITVGSATLSSLLLKDVDFVCGWAPTDDVKLALRSPVTPAPPLVFADYGVNMLGAGIFVRADLARTNPELVSRFLKATALGAVEVQRNPDEGVDAILKENPELDRTLLEEEVKAIIPFVHSSHTVGRPYGWVSPDDWKSTIELLQKYYGLQSGISPDDFYTNKFLPDK